MFSFAKVERIIKLTRFFRLASPSAVSPPSHSPFLVDFCSLVTMTSSARYVSVALNNYCDILTSARSGTLCAVRELVHCKVTTTVSAAWVSATTLFRFALVLGTLWCVS